MAEKDPKIDSMKTKPAAVAEAKAAEPKETTEPKKKKKKTTTTTKTEPKKTTTKTEPKKTTTKTEPKKTTTKTEPKKSVKGGVVVFGKGKKQKKGGGEKRKTFIEKPIGGEKNGGTRMVRVKKLPAYYATQLNPKKRTKHTKNTFRALRSTITPGTVCILLAGIHKGKRVIFLKQLAGGLCLVTGPFKVNACPMRRVNQIYLIATATKVDLSGLTVPKHINDKYFRRVKAKRAKKEEGDIFEQKQEKYVPSEERKKDQATVDGLIMQVFNKRDDKKMLLGYLGTPFGLRNRMYPHRLKF